MGSTLVNNVTSSSSKPLWQRLGYTSEEAYLKAFGQTSSSSTSSSNSKVNTTATKPTATANTAASTTSATTTPTSTEKGVDTLSTLKADSASALAQTASQIHKTAGSDISSTDNIEHYTDTDTNSSLLNYNKYGSTYNSESNFEDWYKNRYGTDYDGSTFSKLDGMSDDDWEIGQSLYNKYNSYNRTTADLLENYNKSKNELDTSKKNSQQMASITYDKLKKYLPTQIAAQGLGGLGTSESTLLQAYNNYANSMSDIASDYNAKKSDIDSDYNAATANALSNYLENSESGASELYEKYKSAVESEWSSNYQTLSNMIANSTSTNVDDITSIFNNYNLSDNYKQLLTTQAKEQAESNAKAEADNTSTGLSAYIENYTDNEDYQGALLFLEKNKDSINENDYNAYRSYLEYQISVSTLNDYIDSADYNSALEYLEKNKDTLGDSGYSYYSNEITNKVNNILSGNETLTYGGKNYQITSNTAVDDIVNASIDGSVIQYALSTFGNNIPNGVTFNISFNGYKYVTYFNGHWYQSKKV
jgi:hypothetical protein